MPGKHRYDTCHCGRDKQVASRQCAGCKNGWKDGLTPAAPVVEPTVETDRANARRKDEVSSLKERYKHALEIIADLEAKVETVVALDEGIHPFRIEPKHGSGTSEGTAVAVASDWHIEELVGAEVNGLNVYNPEIARERAIRFFQSLVRLVKLLQQDIRIDSLILALLGDFITNQIHDAENAETNALQPTHALVTAQNYIVSGIEFLLNHTKLKLLIPCHSGNHGRTTKTTRFTSENGHSFEYLMYLHLQTYFKGNDRVQFIIPPGMHSYVDVYGSTIRFHHGHAIKYGGGVGGIYIPVNKAIAQWNKGRHADLDVFGHFHQLRDGGNFLCNGSLIGYNGYAMSIKADYEKPRQTLFLMDKKRGRTCTWPILVEGSSK